MIHGSGASVRPVIVFVAMVCTMLGCEKHPPSDVQTQKTVASVTSKEQAKPAISLASAASSSSVSEEIRNKEGRASGKVREFTLRFDDTPVGPMQAVVVVPREASPHHRLPVLIAMHGQGEALKGPAKGARGWVDDYWLGKALRRLNAPPLTNADFRHRFSEKRLDMLNQSLFAQPFRGLIVVCPYTPHKYLKGKEAFSQSLLADFIVDTLLPQVYEQAPAMGTPASTAIDGVSLGGRASLLVGLARPEAFGAIGALQPAFDGEDAPELAKRARNALKKNPSLTVRFLTSDNDYYLESTRTISKRMEAEGVKPMLDVVPGDHSYDFNRGPGVYEMLLFHERVLRGEHAPGTQGR
jgi:enterochelin esterase-like enzyme